jgi:hypothetical protein
MSSDALLVNVFCHPRVLKIRALTSMLGIEIGEVPEFGFKARVPLRSGRTDRTEIDMKVGGLLGESKLAGVVESYRDLEEVFDCGTLPRVGDQYVSLPAHPQCPGGARPPDGGVVRNHEMRQDSRPRNPVQGSHLAGAQRNRCA